MIKYANLKIFLSITIGLVNPAVAKDGTNCNDVLMSLYPNSNVCENERFCSSDFACAVEENNCDDICFAKDVCPEGTHYHAFGESGFMCCPNEICLDDKDENEFTADLEIDFHLEMFTKPTFKPEDTFNGDFEFDLSYNSTELSLVYVQARADIRSDSSDDYMLHIKQCKIERTETINGIPHQFHPVVFITDGCIPSGNTFVDHTFDLKPTRAQWSDDNNDKTIVVDQFIAELWDPEIKFDPNIEKQAYRFNCELVVCQIDSFQRNTEELGYNSICTKHDECPNRYNNLFTNGRYNQNLQNGKYGRSDVIEVVGSWIARPDEDWIGRPTEIAETKPPQEPPVTGGAPYYGLALCLATFVALL